MDSQEKALELLESPLFFSQLLQTVRKAGLVGEQQNALVVFLVGVSRMLATPLSLYIKGHSSAGKNFLATKVLSLFLPTCVQEITSMTDAAWNYFANELMNKIIYVQELFESSGSINPSRQMISEGRLVRYVTEMEGGKRVVRRLVSNGPIAYISTTTKNWLEFDDESRHLSIWVDESAAQTKRIVLACVNRSDGLNHEDLTTWHEAQRLISQRAKQPVKLPPWLVNVIDYVCTHDLRIRRYMPAFLAALKTVCIIRSFQKESALVTAGEKLTAEFTDFAITCLILKNALSKGLGPQDEEEGATLQIVTKLCGERDGKPVGALELAEEMGISMDRAYARLRKAERQGSIKRGNMPQRFNLKVFVPAEPPRFLPDPETIFQRVDCGSHHVKFFHPITGKLLTYSRGCKG